MGWQASGAVKAMQAFREKLPAFKMKAELLQAVNNNQVFLFTEDSTRFKILDVHKC
jgi:ATP-dependent RNA helicase DHX36